jgi:hypothetical protein
VDRKLTDALGDAGIAIGEDDHALSAIEKAGDRTADTRRLTVMAYEAPRSVAVPPKS